MSQASPGWYPDPSGRFVQRYYDGERWTEHVADAAGNQDTDYPTAAPTGRVARGDYGGQGSGGYGRGGYPSEAGGNTGQRAGYGRENGGYNPDRVGYGGQGGGSGRGEIPGYGADDAPSYGGRAARGHDAGGDPGYGGIGPDDAVMRGPGEGPGQRAPGHGPRGHGGPRGQSDYDPTPYGQAVYDRGPTSTAGFNPTVGLIVTAVGGLFVLLSLFALDFLSIDVGGVTESATLREIADGTGASGALDLYADLGRFVGPLVIALAVVAALRLPQLASIPQLPTVAAIACGLFLVWNVVAMLSGLDASDISTSPAGGAFVGAVGYAAMAAGQFLRQPVGGARH